jgi:hypothetical protein
MVGNGPVPTMDELSFKIMKMHCAKAGTRRPRNTGGATSRTILNLNGQHGPGSH